METTTPDLTYEVATLLRAAGKAHHEAFIETDGVDEDWPLWYAEHLKDDLRRMLNAKFTKSELVYMLVTADKEMALLAPGADWPTFWAKLLVERYT